MQHPPGSLKLWEAKNKEDHLCYCIGSPNPFKPKSEIRHGEKIISFAQYLEACGMGLKPNFVRI